MLQKCYRKVTDDRTQIALVWQEKSSELKYLELTEKPIDGFFSRLY
jgi:hypothetical protein